jgi:hypothetical protein
LPQDFGRPKSGNPAVGFFGIAVVGVTHNEQSVPGLVLTG